VANGGDTGAQTARVSPPSDWQAVGRAMLAAQVQRYKSGKPYSEVTLAQLRFQLLGYTGDKASLIALLEAASDAFGDATGMRAAPYKEAGMPNFMWVPKKKVISFME
jgi:hypothetical protein